MGSYEIKVNGLLMATKPTKKGALALVTEKFHGYQTVTIERGGVVLWSSKS